MATPCRRPALRKSSTPRESVEPLPVAEVNVLRCPISQLVFQGTGLQAPRTLSCCARCIATGALTQVLCSKQVPCCPMCQAILPFHNSTDYDVDSATISKLRAVSSPSKPVNNSGFDSARERLNKDRTEPVDLFVSTCFVNTAQEKALKSAQLIREKNRKASELAESKRLNIALSTLEQNRRAGELRERMATARTCVAPGDCVAGNTAVVPVLHAEQAQQHKILPKERLLRIPPQGFVLKISRGMLIGRLREMIAAKMGVQPTAVELKLVSQHTLCMPRSRMSSFPVENWSKEEVVEKTTSSSTVSAFLGFDQKPHSINHPTVQANTPGECKAVHAGSLPEAYGAAGAKNARARAGYARSDSDPAAPLWKCKAVEASSTAIGSQGERRIPHLQEWKPSCPSEPCRGQSAADCASPSRPGKHGKDTCPERPTSAGKGKGVQMCSPELARKEHAPAPGGVQATNAGKHVLDVEKSMLRNLRGAGANAANATSAVETADSAGVESHRLSLCTSVSSHDSGETAHSIPGAQSNFSSRDAPDETTMASLKQLRAAPDLRSSSKDNTLSKDRFMHPAEEDVSASLSILSEETSNSDQISAALELGTQQDEDRMIDFPPSLPTGIMSPENAMECFERSTTERLDPSWVSMRIHESSTELEDDKKSLWDIDGRESCIGLWKDADGHWVVAAFKPLSTQQADDTPVPCQKLAPLPLEGRDGAICGKLSTCLLLQASVDMDRVVSEERDVLEQVLQLQQVACARQQSGLIAAQRDFRGEGYKANRRQMPLGGFPFQERICLVVVPQQHDTQRSTMFLPAHAAGAGHAVLDQKVCDGENVNLCSMQRIGKSQVAARWYDVQQATPGERFSPLLGGKVALLVGTGHITPRPQGPKTVLCAAGSR